MALRILIVDRSPQYLKRTEELLADSGISYSVYVSEDIRNAIDIAYATLPDMILFGYSTADADTQSLLTQLHRHESTRQIPVISLIRISDEEVFLEAASYNAADYLSIPFNREVFFNSLRKAEMKTEMNGFHSNDSRTFEEISRLEALVVDSGKTPFAFIVLKPSGEFEWANEGFESLHGYTLEEYRQNYGNTIYGLDPASELGLLFNQCLRHKESTDCICRIKPKTGAIRWVQLFLTPQINSDGAVDRLIAVEMDITAFKNKEAELNAQYQQMKEFKQNLELANAMLEEQKQKIDHQRKTIELEQQKSEKLLLNILPFEVAKQLKSKGKAGTRQYKLVSVLFADFKGFSNFSKSLDPKDLVSILDSYFAMFDEIAGRHYIEKIKTIGDAYMCAGGLPLSNKSNPIDAVLAGLEIQHYLNNLNDSKVLHNLPVWELRLGIHTGPVVAGVIGKKRFAYDIWGDTVNIASRMEQSGHVGMVNISGTTYEYVKDFFQCDYRGKIETKNLGRIDMYFVNRIRPEFSSDIAGIIPNDPMINFINKL